MRIAYADPPYLGMCARYDHNHPDGRCWDLVETHRLLVERLCNEYPDGWAISLSSVSLRTILPICPEKVRVMAWVKSWASWKPGVDPAYAWEPVILFGGRKGKRGRKGEPRKTTDWVRTVARQEGFFGAKPDEFVWWVLAALDVRRDDDFVDLFPGSGAVTRAWESWRRQSVSSLFSPRSAVRSAVQSTLPVGEDAA